MSVRSEHPSDEALLDFLGARERREDADMVTRHLRSGCVRCLRTIHRRARALRNRAGGDLTRAFREWANGSGDGAIARHFTQVERQVAIVEAERVAAPALFEDLLLLGPEARRDAVRGSDRYQFYGLAELLTEEARRACFHDVTRAVDLGRLAVDVAEVLEGQAYPPGLAVDARALAWAALGNAHRVRADLVDADRALTLARDLVEQGSQDRSARAEVLSLLGSLRTDQAAFDPAVQVLEEAAAIYRRDGDVSREAKVLMKLGNAAGYGGDAERAVVLVGRARKLLEEEAASELVPMAGLSFAGWLLESGRGENARMALEALQRDRATWEESFFLRQRVAWVGARIAWAEGDHATAERQLVAVRDEYGDHDEVYDVCLVTLDLATLHLEQGRTQQVRQLAHQLIPIFASRRIHHHALAALALFQQAAEAEQATVSLVRDIARYLQHARRNPYLPYEPALHPRP